MDLKLAIIDEKVWGKYEEWIASVIEEGTTDSVREYRKKEKEKREKAELSYAQRIIEKAEKQKDIPTRKEAIDMQMIDFIYKLLMRVNEKGKK